MSTHLCIDCDSPGDGMCPVCHGTGSVSGVVYAGAFDDHGHDSSCPSCHGTGECPKCGGLGEVEVGGEG